MKKLLTLVIAGGMMSFLACGPSKAELEAKAKATQDSIRMADSLQAVEAAAKGKKGTPKTKQQKEKDEVKKIVKERG